LIATAWQDAARDTLSRWSAEMIHDSVAAIAKQPAYATSIRQSLLGRFVVMAAVALIVVVIVGRIVVARRIDEQRSRIRAGRVGARDRADYWGAARELANRGEYSAACHALYAAVLDSLARSGAVRVHPSKTSGDYSRELARRAAIATPAFAAFARQFERTVFSTESVTSDDFDRLFAEASRIVEPSVAA